MRMGCRRPSSRGRAVACLLVAGLMVSGCGGGSSSHASSSLAGPSRSPSSYGQQATALCQSMRDSLRHLGPAPHAGSGAQLAKAGKYFSRRESDVARTIDRLSALHPPGRERPAVNQLLRTMRRTDQLETNQFRAALRGYRPGFLRASAAIRPTLGVEGKAAAAAHLSACGLGGSR